MGKRKYSLKRGGGRRKSQDFRWGVRRVVTRQKYSGYVLEEKSRAPLIKICGMSTLGQMNSIPGRKRVYKSKRKQNFLTAYEV